MDLPEPDLGSPSRLRALLDHFALIEDTREPHRVAYPLQEVLFLAVCGTIVDCDDYDAIAWWGKERLDFLRRFLPFHHGVPCGRWLTILMNRVNPALFSACFTAWVRECWPDRPDLIAIDGKTSRRSHDRASGTAPLHLVSAFATTSRLVLAQEAVPDKANELAAIPVLLDRLGADGGLEGAIVSIDAIAFNGTVAKAVRDAGRRRPAGRQSQPADLEERVRGPVRRPGHTTAAVRPPRQGARQDRATPCVSGPRGGMDRRRAAPFRANCACPVSPVWSGWRAGPNSRTAAASTPDTSNSSASLTALKAAEVGQGSLGYRELPPPGPRRHIQRRPVSGSAKDTVPETWPSSATSASTSSAKPRSSHPSMTGLRRPRQNPAPPRPVRLKMRRKMAGWDTTNLTKILAVTPR